MKLYSYAAILSKTMLMQGKITYTDKRQRAEDCMVGLPLDSELVTGYMTANSAEEAKELTIVALKHTYPVVRHYSNHENVTVQYVEEQVYE